MMIPEKFSEKDIEDLIEAFKIAGAIVVPGTGKIFVAGEEINIVDALKQGFEDTTESE